MTSTFAAQGLQTPIASGLVPYAAATIDVYEACVRASEELQRAVARAVQFAPARYALSHSADLMRDTAATHASWSRWTLGL
jgi:hypothetical protein